MGIFVVVWMGGEMLSWSGVGGGSVSRCFGDVGELKKSKLIKTVNQWFISTLSSVQDRVSGDNKEPKLVPQGL